MRRKAVRKRLWFHIDIRESDLRGEAASGANRGGGHGLHGRKARTTSSKRYTWFSWLQNRKRVTAAVPPVRAPAAPALSTPDCCGSRSTAPC